MSSKFAMIVGGTVAAVGGYFALTSESAVSIEGKTVLITGGGSGVGRLTAIKFASEGCHVVLWDLNEKGMRETVELVRKASGGSVECMYRVVDVSKPSVVYAQAKMLNDSLSRQGKNRSVDILVNNAGIVSGKSLLDTEDSRIQKTFDVNCLAHFWTTKAFLPEMQKRGYGHIVTIASVAGLTSAPQMIDYAASKHAAVGFASGLRKELKQSGCETVKTSLLCPAHISTNLFKGFKQPIFGSLTPQYVANKIFESVVYRREMMVLPKSADPRMLQALLPTWLVDRIGSVLGIDDSMKHFDPKQANRVISQIQTGTPHSRM